MALNKFDKTSDAIADLYRASFCFAKQSKDVGISFLLKAKKKLGDKMTLNINEITDNYTYWAEKILDEYKRLKMNLSSN
ncbi:MAG: hypothetical protein ACD_57C00350G0003 [uncultured bacterium]|uniref:HEPN domain-containing protein n=1 Tax=Candidatus Woesebacteria bacterium RIFCSPHIGHO2_12_FULL_41_24 TaxID=1802510 RepID=A0A1F8ATB1_9BACT|nr:MAG: hypothetical protein ACD_57C00350G0003 [uncultured bacterium]OGM14799.1 MAG: hypothetical protein A2W15_00475 [Candidatus Woesebacteria bacterium RBG_16_41_13]OGM30292.1 MAG: hypothetical protein A2873_05180 [Candidatus Woesebacteria bacterium RIFCSPHIGHO2_01_FULL_42_80]OGM34331.1 MAG: hypothetical protein A3D84_04765 [Candidatus Woesebacteria bacterium RIFCSPHIGHO2_02_FULL_42_20]OGM54982.1 MAG: hypothetical protein A3E44_05035 [Candidatus Woesebacteria bacterium RIFCSPHIGHO2_12_FULL_41